MRKEFETAYENYADALFRHCFFRVSSRETALDLVQESFLKTWDYMQKGEKIINLKSFLYRVVNNSIIDFYRKRKSESLDALAEDGFDPPVRHNEDIMSQTEYNRAISFFEKLSEQYRSVMIMRFIDGMAIPEIAEILNETENNVSVRIHRGLEKIRKLMEI